MAKRRDCCLECKHWRAPYGGRKNATCAAEEEHETPCAGSDTHELCCGCTAFEKRDAQAVEEPRENPDPICADCQRDLPPDGYCPCHEETANAL